MEKQRGRRRREQGAYSGGAQILWWGVGGPKTAQIRVLVGLHRSGPELGPGQVSEKGRSKILGGEQKLPETVSSKNPNGLVHRSA